VSATAQPPLAGDETICQMARGLIKAFNRGEQLGVFDPVDVMRVVGFFVASVAMGSDTSERRGQEQAIDMIADLAKQMLPRLRAIHAGAGRPAGRA